MVCRRDLMAAAEVAKRVAAAQISHETNVFSAVRTDLAAFQAAGLQTGPVILPEAKGTNSAFGGFQTGAARHGFELIPLVSVWATPSGMVSEEAITGLAGMLEFGLRQVLASGPLDGILLALHGAMVTEIDHDGDGYLLDVARRVVGSAVPIVATLDLHANISQRMVDLADVLIGYDTYPHVDMAARAEEACDVLAQVMNDEIVPVAVLRKPPMMPTSQRMITDRPPMRDLIALAHEMEAGPEVINVTVAGGFPPADVADAGFGVMVTTHNEPELAARLADQLATRAWQLRDGFLGGVSTFVEATAIISELDDGDGDGPLVIVDIGDNPWTGGPGDSAELVRFLMTLGVTDAAVALIADPMAVQDCIAAGVGATVEISLGGKTDELNGSPLLVLGHVRLISDGRYRRQGPMMTGLEDHLGLTVVLRCLPAGAAPGVAGGIDVLVTSRAETPIDLNIFRTHGIEPMTRRIIGLKGKGHFRAAFEPIACRVVLVEGPGITGADLSRLPFRHIRRPIWPLDVVE